MILKERLEEIENYFWDESNDEDTQDWRMNLNVEEEKLVSAWDRKFSNAIVTICSKILSKNKINPLQRGHSK